MNVIACKDAATPVSCIHVYDNSTMLALGTRDGRVLLYDLRSEECTASLRVGCDTACVTTNPDNTWIVCCSLTDV